MPLITLVSDQHDDNIAIGMIPQLLQPPRDIFVGNRLGDIVNKEGTNSSAIVCASNGTVALLAGRIPNLSLNGLVVDLNGTSGELNADGGLGVKVELVARESRKKVRFTDARVANQDNCKEWG